MVKISVWSDREQRRPGRARKGKGLQGVQGWSGRGCSRHRQAGRQRGGGGRAAGAVRRGRKGRAVSRRSVSAEPRRRKGVCAQLRPRCPVCVSQVRVPLRFPALARGHGGADEA